MAEGNIGIGGLSGAGKTFVALSIAKALTTGRNFVGCFRVPEKYPVIYLVPEVGDRAFRHRARKFGIPEDEKMFLCRTLSKGATLALDHPDILMAVKNMGNPVVMLDTAIRFSKAKDESSATDNVWMEKSVRALREAGAIAVAALHHSPKNTEKHAPTLENTFRGTGDIGALFDVAYSIRNDKTIPKNEGEQVRVVCVKPRDFEPPAPFNLGLKGKDSAGKLFSFIDTTGDLVLMAAPALTASAPLTKEEITQNEKFLKLVEKDPSISKNELASRIGVRKGRVGEIAANLDYERVDGKWAQSEEIEESEEFDFMETASSI